MCRPGLIDIVTSFPVLIIMIYMKLTQSVAGWIVKLPAFRIYILRFKDELLNATPLDSFAPYVSKAGDSSFS